MATSSRRHSDETAPPDRMEQGRTFAFTDYYERTKNGKEMERLARRLIALADPRVQALGLKRNGFLHSMLAKALTMQGREAEARREIAEARTRADDMTGNALPKMLKELEARLG